MSRKYTAQEMREAANAVDEVSINDNGEYFYEKHEKFNPFLVRDMLRQAADAMEREEKIEKKYEYAAMTDDGWVERLHFDMVELIEDTLYDGDKLVCREVGEWEVVPNG